MNDAIHYSDWSQQPSVHILCTDKYTTPAWTMIRTELPEHVYEDDDGELYTFELERVTCTVCKECL